MEDITKKNNGAQTAGEEKVSKIEENVDSSSKSKRENSKKIMPKKIDNEQLVVVKNGFQGRLVYISKRTGERFVWDEFGSEQEVELRELKSAKNTYKKFFENNWFMFDEGWVVDYLGVKQYYKNAIDIDSFDDIFVKTPEEITEIIGKLSNGQKKSVAYRAQQLIAEEKIDSRKVTTALEKALSIELVEK